MPNLAQYQRGFGRRKPGPWADVDFTPQLGVGLKGAWLFNQAGRGFDATNFNALPAFTSFTWGVGGFGGPAVKNSAIGGKISAGAGAKIANLRPLTALCWVNLTASSSNMLFFKTNNDGGIGWWLGIDDNSKLAFIVSTSGTDNGAIYNTVFPAGAWTQAAVTWDGTVGGGITLYVNGQLVAVTTQAGSGTFGDDSATALLIGGATVGAALTPGIGFWTGGAGGTFGLDGTLDHAFLWNRALLPAEVFALYREPFAFMRTAAPSRHAAFVAAAAGPPVGKFVSVNQAVMNAATF